MGYLNTVNIGDVADTLGLDDKAVTDTQDIARLALQEKVEQLKRALIDKGFNDSVAEAAAGTVGLASTPALDPLSVGAAVATHSDESKRIQAALLGGSLLGGTAVSMGGGAAGGLTGAGLGALLARKNRAKGALIGGSLGALTGSVALPLLLSQGYGKKLADIQSTLLNTSAARKIVSLLDKKASATPAPAPATAPVLAPSPETTPALAPGEGESEFEKLMKALIIRAKRAKEKFNAQHVAREKANATPIKIDKNSEEYKKYLQQLEANKLPAGMTLAEWCALTGERPRGLRM